MPDPLLKRMKKRLSKCRNSRSCCGFYFVKGKNYGIVIIGIFQKDDSGYAMTNAVGLPSPISSALAARAVTPAAKQAETNDPQATAAQNAAATFSQRFRNDPQAGLILEYLGDNGQLVSQVPSQTVVAYLRAGLTAEGVKREIKGDAVA